MPAMRDLDRQRKEIDTVIKYEQDTLYDIWMHHARWRIGNIRDRKSACCHIGNVNISSNNSIKWYN